MLLVRWDWYGNFGKKNFTFAQFLLLSWLLILLKGSSKEWTCDIILANRIYREASEEDFLGKRWSSYFSKWSPIWLQNMRSGITVAILLPTERVAKMKDGKSERQCDHAAGSALLLQPDPSKPRDSNLFWISFSTNSGCQRYLSPFHYGYDFYMLDLLYHYYDLKVFAPGYDIRWSMYECLFAANQAMVIGWPGPIRYSQGRQHKARGRRKLLLWSEIQ